MADIRWVPLAEVARPHGVRGEVRVKMYNSDSELLPSLSEVLVRRRDGAERTIRLQSVRGADAGYLLAKLEGVDDRDAAESFRGAELCVRRDAFPPLEEGEFYACDVVGARLYGPDGELGIVEDLASYPTADVLIGRLSGGTRCEIPLVEDYIAEIDTAARQVRLTSAALDFVAASLKTSSHAD
jgi:16S rRNA processing protein RimM